MLIISGAPVPDLPPDKLCQLCRHWENLPRPRLSAAQKAHLDSFAPQAIHSRCSSVLARLLLMRELPDAGILAMDPAGRPVFPASKNAAAFSHSAQAAFCAAYIGNDQKVNLALDACGKDELDVPGLLVYFQKLATSPPVFLTSAVKTTLIKSWLCYETLIKLFDIHYVKKYFNYNSNFLKIMRRHFSQIQLNERTIWLKFFSFYGHWLCVGADRNIFGKIVLKWEIPQLLFIR